MGCGNKTTPSLVNYKLLYVKHAVAHELDMQNSTNSKELKFCHNHPIFSAHIIPPNYCVAYAHLYLDHTLGHLTKLKLILQFSISN